MLKFELFSCLIVLYDCVMLPYVHSFGLDEFSDNQLMVLNYIDWAIQLIFLIDLLLSFFKAFTHHSTGEEICDHKKIAKRYLKFYFWLDLIPILPIEDITGNQGLVLLNLLKVIRL